ncbi:MAG: hypothetical protein QM778_07970 [Myxococcales bacterium]
MNTKSSPNPQPSFLRAATLASMGSFGLSLWLFLFSACGGAKPAAVAPPPPTPPTDAMAWMPEDSMVLGHALIAPFKGTPFWDLWASMQAKQRRLQFWVDSNLVDELTLSAKNVESAQPSFVAVVKGRFGEGYLEGLGTREQLVAQQRGLLRLYVRPEAVWCQLNAELILAASADRADWLVARASQGPATPIKDAPLYNALAGRLGFETAELAVLVDDPEGKGKQRLEEDSARFGVGIPSGMIDEMRRAGVAVDMGPEIALLAVGEAATPEGAQSMRESAEHSLNSLTNNMFVGMFGLRPFVSAIQAENEGNHVKVHAKYLATDLYGLLSKLQSVLGMASGRGASTSSP